MAMGQIGFGRSGHEYQPLSPAVPGPSLRQSPALSSNSACSPALSLSNITSPTLRSSRPTSSRDSFPPSSSFAPTFPPSVRDPTLRVTSPSIFPQSFSSRDRVTSPSVLHSRETIVRSPPTFQQQHHAFAIPPLSHREAIPVQRDSRDMLVHRDSIPSQSTSHTDSVTMRSRRDSMGSIPISSHSQREVASREALGRDPMSHTDYRARRDSIGSHPSQVIPSSQPSHRDSLAQIPTHRESLPSHRDSLSSHRDSIITHAHRDSISSQEGIPRIHRDSISSLSSHSSNHEPVSSHLLHRSPVLPRDPRLVPSLLTSLGSQSLRESLFERETGQLHRERDMISGRDPRGRSFPMQIPPISTHPSITHHRDRSHSITVAGLPPRENVVTVPPREHVALPREHVGNREHVREHVIIDQITREHTAHTPTITPIPSREQQPVPAFPPISIQERVTSPIYLRDGAPTRDRVTSSREHHNASPILSREHVTSPVSARERIPSPLVAKEYVPSHPSARESIVVPRERLSIATHFDPLHERAISPISTRERVPSPTVARERPPSPVVVRERHPSPIITRERFPSPLTTKDREGSSIIQHANEREERVVSPTSSRDLMNTEVIIPRERPSISHPEPRREKTSTSSSISGLLQRDRVPSTSSLTLSLDMVRHPQPSSSERIASPIASSPPKEKKTVSPNVSPPSKQPIPPPIVPVSSTIIPLPTPTQRVVSPIIPTPTSMTKRSPPGSQTGRAIAHAHVYGKVEEHTPKKVEMIDEVKVERRESVVPPTPAPSTPMKDEPMPLAGSEVETKQAKHPKHKESSHLHNKDKVTEQPPKRPSSATAHKEKLTPPKRPLSATSHKDGMTHEDAHEWFLEHFADSPAPKKKKPNHSSSTSLEDDLTKELERELADVDTPMADVNEEEAERMEVDVEDELLSLVQDEPAKEKLVLPPVPPVRKASMKKKASEERDRESMPPPATTTVKTKKKPGPKPKTSKPTTKTTAKPGPKGKKEAPVPLKGKAASISVSRSRSTSVMPGDAQEEGQDEKTEEKEKEVEDDKVYCVCKRKYDEGRTMIGCDKCDDWYHMQCVNMSELEVELVDQFICPPCIQKNPQLNLKTTYKTRCLNGLDDPDPSSTEACHRPSKGALSKYCSPECGVKYMRRRIDAYTARGGSREVLWSKVKDAERREGVVVHCQTGAVMKSKTKAEREIERLAGPLEAIGKARAGLRRAMECVLWRERVWELACQRAEAGGDICGWDQRLCFGEEEWEEWGDGVEESYAADADDNDAEWWCPGPKDCERHHGWQSIRQDDINNEKTKGEEAIMKLTTKEREIRKQMEDLVGAESADIDRDAKPGPLKSNGKVINVNGNGVKNVKGKVKVNGDDKKTLKRKKR
ncbi:uncharacterized protein EV420DRAFT_941613 [Desarmillaria tabescens]|uniref:PHD-type domain-containing protein n=1 Tax=Armillaria tabescens TaxID=1929756 RepID=A0AA39TNJ0_ARMTA|nr:uncharacterized protein EV420DRAFT_941613 [Desarmillaria tabescens]KAK0465132.1 hypothetical protein EV420DRAFT_941613 [Desarmillaria tabescens]